MFLGEGALLAVIRHWQSSFVRHQALDAMQCGAIHENLELRWQRVSQISHGSGCGFDA
jgi:hypothetical protein